VAKLIAYLLATISSLGSNPDIFSPPKKFIQKSCPHLRFSCLYFARVKLNLPLRVGVALYVAVNVKGIYKRFPNKRASHTNSLCYFFI
jgi:hypothetical protein